MHEILLLGSGKIGRMIAKMLTDTGEYRVRVGDADTGSLARLAERVKVEALELDVTHEQSLLAAMAGCDCVVSALPYFLNPEVAAAALKAGVSYFDLTEDIETTNRVRATAAQARPGQVFMPQSGLAPGFVSIAAQHLAKQFDELDAVRMRVGALPQYPANALKYNLTWSTDGLINEYCNPCESIHERRRIETLPLEGLEHFSIDGVRYEAFNTSGGLGTLCDTLEGSVRELNYKTIRYQGHRDLAAFLVGELRLSERRQLLKEILERAVPLTFQDVVVIFCTVTGMRKGQLVQISDARKIYNQTIDGEEWSAIQVTTSAGLCAVLDMHLAGKLPRQGFVRQEEVSLPDFLANRFGRQYSTEHVVRVSGELQ